jgi:hypothetical protein
MNTEDAITFQILKDLSLTEKERIRIEHTFEQLNLKKRRTSFEGK